MIQIKRIENDVRLPEKSNPWTIDIFCHYKTESGRPNKLLIPPRSARAVPTGLIIVPSSKCMAAVTSRYLLAKERSIFVLDAPAIIDPNYRGETAVLLYNGGVESYYVSHGDRIAQVILLPSYSLEIEEVP